jgi:hypothetical protein
MTIPNTTYRILVEKLGAQDPASFVGNEGEIFYNPNTPLLKLSNGSTVGGVSIGGTAGSDTGDITFDGIKIIGFGTGSGDGNGYSTIELVPDEDLYNNDQYIIVDPTSPGHIHLRAGGEQDDSQALLFLGGESNFVRVVDGQGVRLINTSYVDTIYTYEDGVDFTDATWVASGGGSYIEFTTTDSNLISNSSQIFDLINDNVLEIFTSEGSFIVTPTAFQNQGGNVWRFSINQIPSPTPQTITDIYITLYDGTTNSLVLENADLNISVGGNISIASTLGNLSIDSSVGIGTTTPSSKLTVQDGDIRVGVNTSNGLILTDSNGVSWRLIVNTNGTLATSAI